MSPWRCSSRFSLRWAWCSHPNHSSQAPRNGSGGLLLLRLAVGETSGFESRNEAQARFWSTSYPTAAVVEVMRLVDLAKSQLPLNLGQSLLTLYSAHDQVVSPTATLEALEQIEAPHKRTIDFGIVGDLMNHVLAGDILSPDGTDELVARIVEFVHATNHVETASK